ncbi:MAG TPA: hypothetical protein VNO55_17225 [Polyangia bacterium]|nr:hypothetical protein [Polyangia bacterium]
MNIRRSLQRLSSVACVFLLAAGCGSSSSSNNNTGSGGNGGGNSGSGGKNAGSGGNNAGSGGSNAGSGGGSAMALVGDGCAGGTCQNPMCKPLGTAVAIDMFPQIGFEPKPAYIPMDTIIPTFDDAPDGQTDPMDADFKVYGPGQYTKDILTFFKMNNLHMDFFINTDNWCGDISMDSDCIATLTDILKTQNPANHTVHHIHMGMELPPDAVNMVPTGCGTAAACEAELTGVETIVKGLSYGGRPHLTRFRAPFGEPYQASGPGLAIVQPVVAKYAVSVGWQMDSGDSNCDSTTAPCYTGQMIANNVITLIGTAPGQAWGVLLMHGTFPWTKDAVPLLFDPANGYLVKHGFKTATIEDVICWKYGKHSWEIIQQLGGDARGPN